MGFSFPRAIVRKPNHKGLAMTEKKQSITETLTAPLAVQQLDSLPDSAALSIRNAGVILDASRSTIYRLFKSNALTPLKIGGSTRIRVGDLRRLLGVSPSVGTTA